MEVTDALTYAATAGTAFLAAHSKTIYRFVRDYGNGKREDKRSESFEERQNFKAFGDRMLKFADDLQRSFTGISGALDEERTRSREHQQRHDDASRRLQTLETDHRHCEEERKSLLDDNRSIKIRLAKLESERNNGSTT